MISHIPIYGDMMNWLDYWYRSGDTGTSSETIARVLTRERMGRMDAPHDTSDVGRCIRLLDIAEANGERWRDHLDKVAIACPAWAPLVPRWAEIEAAYHEDVKVQTASRKAFDDDRWLRKDGSRRKAPRHCRQWRCPPSRCWHIVSVLRGHGDPCASEDVPWARVEGP